jgi:hypothetical protein
MLLIAFIAAIIDNLARSVVGRRTALIGASSVAYPKFRRAIGVLRLFPALQALQERKIAGKCAFFHFSPLQGPPNARIIRVTEEIKHFSNILFRAETALVDLPFFRRAVPSPDRFKPTQEA